MKLATRFPSSDAPRFPAVLKKDRDSLLPQAARRRRRGCHCQSSPMKTQIKLLLGPALFCAGSILWFAFTPSVAPVATSAEPAAPQRRKSGVVEFAADPAATAATHDAAANSGDDEPSSVMHWQTRLAALLDQYRDRDEARAALVAELDEAYCRWASPKIAALAALPPRDRYDPLAEMDTRLRIALEGLPGHLGITGVQRSQVLVKTLEAISAETQYAEFAGTHDQRVAMLRLDRERGNRFEKLVAANGLGHGTETQVRTEIQPWYESQLRGIVGANDTEEAN